MTNLLARVRVPALCILTAIAAIVVHEAGHAVAGVLSGGRVAEVVLFSLRPHVSMEGPFTRDATAFTAAAGTASLSISWALWAMLAGPGPAARASVRAFSVMAFIEACGWLLSSLLYPWGPRSEDGWTFLEQSAINPVWSGVVALVIGLAALRVFLGADSQPSEILSVSALRP